MERREILLLALFGLVVFLKAFDAFLNWRERQGKRGASKPRRKKFKPTPSEPPKPSPLYVHPETLPESPASAALAPLREQVVREAKETLSQETLEWEKRQREWQKRQRERANRVKTFSAEDAWNWELSPDGKLVRVAWGEPRNVINIPEDVDGMRSLLQVFARDAVTFHRRVDRGNGTAWLSFFGGVPIAPPDWKWPRSWKTGYPLTFVMQVDLSTLPDNDVSKSLPNDGALYFFYDTTTKGYAAIRGCVDYHPGPTTDWIQATPPADMLWTTADSHSEQKENGDKISSFSKVEVVPVPIKDYPFSPGDLPHDLEETIVYDKETFERRGYSGYEFWRKVASELTTQESIKAKNEHGPREIGLMGGYIRFFQNGTFYNHDIPPLMNFFCDEGGEFNTGYYYQYGFSDDWNDEWIKVLVDQE